MDSDIKRLQDFNSHAELELFYRMSVAEAVEKLGELLDDGRRKGGGLVPVVSSEPEGIRAECPVGGAGERRGNDALKGDKAAWFGVDVGLREERGA